jgi:hypothetical protein
MPRTRCFVLLAALPCAVAAAQVTAAGGAAREALPAHADFLHERARYEPMALLRGQLLPDAGLRQDAGSFDLLLWAAAAAVPLPTSADSFLTLGASFEQRRYQAKDLGGFADEKLYAAALDLGFASFLADDVLLEAEVRPGVWTDWNGALTRDDFDIPTKLLVTDRAATNLFLAFGARYDEVYPRNSLLPYLGCAWQPCETVRVDVLAPESVEVSLGPRPDLGFLLGGEVQGAEYHVRAEAAAGRIHSDVRVQEVLVYAGALWRWSTHAAATVRIGVTAAGDYRLDDSRLPSEHADGTLQPGPFVELTFGFDF